MDRIFVGDITPRAVVMILESISLHLTTYPKLAIGEPGGKTASREGKRAEAGAKDGPIHKSNS